MSESSKNLGFFTSCIKFIIFLLCLICATYQGVILFERYLKEDFSTSVEFVPIKGEYLPQITICPSHPFDLAALEKYNTSTLDLLYKPWNFDNVTKVLEEVLSSSKLITDKIEIVMYSVQNEEMTNMSLTKDQYLWQPLWTHESTLGLCHSLMLPEIIANDDIGKEITGIHLKVPEEKTPPHMYLHHFGQFFSFKSNHRILFRQNMDIYINIFIEDYEEKVNRKGETPCSPHASDRQDICIQNKIMKENFEKIANCSNPFVYFQNRENSKSICKLQNEEFVRAMMSLQIAIINGGNKICGRPCRTMEVR